MNIFLFCVISISFLALLIFSKSGISLILRFFHLDQTTQHRDSLLRFCADAFLLILTILGGVSSVPHSLSNDQDECVHLLPLLVGTFTVIFNWYSFHLYFSSSPSSQEINTELLHLTLEFFTVVVSLALHYEFTLLIYCFSVLVSDIQLRFAEILLFMEKSDTSNSGKYTVSTILGPLSSAHIAFVVYTLSYLFRFIFFLPITFRLLFVLVFLLIYLVSRTQFRSGGFLLSILFLSLIPFQSIALIHAFRFCFQCFVIPNVSSLVRSRIITRFKDITSYISSWSKLLNKKPEKPKTEKTQ